MIYERVLLENFGIHRRLEFEPSPRLTGIVGRNGTGKSTVLAALELLATGVVPTPGKREANINQLSGKKRSAVSGTIVHAGHRLELVYGFSRNADTSLVLDGGDRIVGADPVRAKLRSVFGDTAALFGNYVFVKQGQIYGFLEETETARAKVFAQLFGTRKAEVCWDLIGKKLSTIQVPGTSEALDQVRKQLGDAKEQLAAYRVQKGDYADVYGYDRDDDPAAALVEKYRAYRAAHAEVRKVEAEAASVGLKRDAKRAEVYKSSVALAKLKGELMDADTAADRAKVTLADWKGYRRRKEAADSLEARYAAILKDKEAHPRPQPREGYIASADQVRLALRDSLSAGVVADERYVATFRDGVAACPTCGTAVAALKAAIDEANARLPLTRGNLAAVKATIAADAQYEKDLAVWKAWSKGYKEKVVAYNADYEALEDERAEPTRTEEELNAVVEAAAALRGRLALASDAYNALAKADAELAGNAAALAKQLRDWKVIRRDNRVDRDDYALARAALKATLARLHARGELIGKINGQKRAISQLGENLATLEAEAMASARAKATVGKLNAMRDVLHRNRLPKLVAAGYLDLIQAGVNRMLARFGADFRVEAAEDLSYTAVFHDGRRQPAIRLSGGQKVLLAVAFRVEVNSLFAGELGLLCLDEPTEFLDSKNIACLDVALAKLRELSDAQGLQCFLVTHERRLGHMFDDVVNL